MAIETGFEASNSRHLAPKAKVSYSLWMTGQVSYKKHKKQLLRSAMKLSVLCDCNVALMVFTSDGMLCQYSSMDEMDKLLEQYAQACQLPHERHTNQDVSEALHVNYC